MDNNKKIKILAYCDSPSVSTGFGKVAKGIFKNLAETGKYDITIFGINDLGGWKDPKEHPYKIYPTMLPGETDVYGRLHFIDILRGGDMEIRPPWDIVFTLNDPFIFEYPLVGFGKGMMEMISSVLFKLYRKTTKPENWFTVVSYWPVDSPLKGNWVEFAIGLANYSVAYCNYGRNEIEKANNQLEKPAKMDLSVIYHGIDINEFFPISKSEKSEFRKKYFSGKVSEGTFVVSCVARNQMRKDLPRTMKIFKEFQRRRPDSVLYLHSKMEDVFGNILELARSFNLEPGKDFFLPKNFDENKGFPVKALNCIYNITDAYLNTTLGEGFGLPIVEAMATKKIVLAPNITSIPEILGTEGNNIEDLKELETNDQIRGIPLKSGSTSSEWVCYGIDDLERMRPITNVDDGVRKLIWVYDNPDKAEKIAERGYNWIQQFTWARIANEWDNLFQRIYKNLEEERKNYKPEKEVEDAVKVNTDQPDSGKQIKSERNVAGPVQQAEEPHGTESAVPLVDSSGKEESLPIA